MDLYIIGALAALLTSLLWTINAVLFTSAGRKIGAISVNAWRILIAAALLWTAHLFMLGRILPEATGEQWFWMGLSGFVGLCVGDFGLFASFVIIGTRRAVLMMSLSAIFASFGAFFLFAEALTVWAIIGISVTLAGVMIVILESEERSTERRLGKREKRIGITLALIGAIGQGSGLAFAKKGMILYPQAVNLTDSISIAVSATLIRMLIGCLTIWLVITVWGKLSELKRALRNRRGMKYTAAGAFIGPFIGVTLSSLAAYLVEAGVAQTLMSLMPIFVIPVVWLLYRQKTSWRGILGACVAVFGVALLFLHQYV